MDKKNRIKLATAILAFLAAGALIAWQFMPSTTESSKASSAPVEDVVTTKQKDGSTVIKQGGRAERVLPGAK